MKDALGSITDIISPTGTVVQRFEYSSYGKIVSIRNGSQSDITSNPAIRVPFAYTGREWDSEVGLYYYRARYYDPSVGRFLQQDPHPGRQNIPISVINKYVYTGNAPTIYTDPSGKIFFAAVIAFSSIAVTAGTSAALAAVTATFLGAMLAGAIYGAVTGSAEAGIKFGENVFNVSAAFLTLNVIGAEMFGGGVAEAGATGPFPPCFRKDVV